MASSPKVLDLDAKFGDSDPTPTAPFRYLGKEWRVLKQFNTVAYGLVQGADDENALERYIDYLVNLVHPDDRGAWGRALAEANLPQARLSELIGALTEVAAEPVPTLSPSGSSGTPVTRVSRRKSTAS